MSRSTLRARPHRSLTVGLVLAALLAGIAPPAGGMAAEPSKPPAKDAPAQCQSAILGAKAPQVSTTCPELVQPLATGLPSGFQESIVWSGLTNPTAIRFASDGRVFVAEKSGIIKVFDNLADQTPTVFSSLTTNVQNYWDRGLLGMALDPSIAGGSGSNGSYIYVLYTYDHILGAGGTAPRWGDTCPTPPGPTTDGCVASGRLARFNVSGTTISGPEQVLIEDWCQQFPSHSIGTLAFGRDGALYLSGGDGASFTVVDYGQLGGSLSGTPTPKNPCGDPPGGSMTPPDAAGGALRSQDVPMGGSSASYASLVAADGASSYWRLAETSGSTATDSRGAASGTYAGTPTLGSTGALYTDSNTAVTLPTIADYVTVADSSAIDFGNGPWSVEFWYKASAANTIRYLVSKGSQFNIYMNPTGNLTVDNDNTAAVQVGSGQGIGSDTTNWHHYVVTRTGSGSTGTRIYQDGVDVTHVVNDITFSSNGTPLSVGRYSGSGFPALGTIDEVALYRTALSQQQVLAHHGAAYAPAASDPTGLNGAILRVDPQTGAAMADNPMAGSSDPNTRRIIANGLRNPFRFTLRPGTDELWLGDVGAGTYEEIDRIANTRDAVVENFGWPCYEGTPRNSGYDNANLSTCEQLYAAGSGAVTPPVFAYDHAARVITGESCPVGSSAIAGMVFYPESGGSFPAAYRGGLFFADHNRNCIWFMPKGSNGQPDPSQRQAFAPGAANPVDLQIGPNGDLFYVDFDTSSIRRISVVGVNQPPTARIVAVPESGPVPLSVAFDGRTSTDPEGGALTYRWDLDGDGAYDDSTSPTPSWQYTSAGATTVRLEVTDPAALTGTTTKVITAGQANTPPVPVIATPTVGTLWSVGQTLAFSGSATDAEDGTLAPARLSWRLDLQHCPSNCHIHTIETYPGVASGSFAGPDHDYPSYLELTLTATDSAGASASVTRRLDPRTVDLDFTTVPAGLELTVGGVTATTPFSRTVIDGSLNSISAPSAQSAGGTSYGFTGWSDGGAASHDITAAAGGSYTATYATAAGGATDIRVIKTGSQSGSRVTFVITVSHVSGVTAQDVTMTDVLPSKLGYVSATSTRGTCGATGSTVTCAIDSLASGQTATITIVTQPTTTKGRITNTASVSTSTSELMTTDNQSSFSLKLR